MPHINTPIKRAWRHKNDTERIDYIIVRADGTERHLYVKADSKPNGLYEVLDEYLRAQGYTQPASAGASK